jgi:hypothetical protein
VAATLVALRHFHDNLVYLLFAERGLPRSRPRPGAPLSAGRPRRGWQPDPREGRARPSRFTLKPLLYKITGVWGNHEGSMLLWVLILALFGAPSPSSAQPAAALRARVLAVQG